MARKNKNGTQKKNLSLKKSTIRRLDHSELTGVAGGATMCSSSPAELQPKIRRVFNPNTTQ